MGTDRKGRGATTVRRRTKGAAKQAANVEQGANSLSVHNTAAEAMPNGELSVETIRMRAYELFLARGAVHGEDLADWLSAERELSAARKF